MAVKKKRVNIGVKRKIETIMEDGKSQTINVWKTLCSPDIFFGFSWKSKKMYILLGCWVSFLVLWIISNQFWNFPWFAFFIITFLMIHTISFGTLKYFYSHMLNLNDDLAGCEAFTKARYFYNRSRQTCVNIYFPLFFILIFGIGGCVLYTNAQLTPTFIMYMVYFVVIVYFSMVVYLQYIRFFYYLYLVAHDNIPLIKLIQPSTPGGKLRVDWLQELINIARAMRYMFASVGLLYIAAFALFCFSPAYGASVTAPIFYILWALIFVFVVLVFFVLNGLNGIHMRKIRDNVKNAYIDELILFDTLPSDEDEFGLNKFKVLLQQICAMTILNSNDFPVRDTSNWVLSAWITAIQVIASLVTLYQFQMSDLTSKTPNLL